MNVQKFMHLDDQRVVAKCKLKTHVCYDISLLHTVRVHIYMYKYHVGSVAFSRFKKVLLKIKIIKKYIIKKI